MRDECENAEAPAVQGLLLMELMNQMQLRPSMRRTKGSILGRSAGTLTKGGLALSMMVLALMSIYS